MKLNIQSLQTIGAFTGRPIEKTVEWYQGEQRLSAEVFVRPLGFQSAVSDVLASTGRVDGVAGRIAASICDEDGNPVFTVRDIVDGPLDPEELAKDPESDKRLGALDGNLTVALLAVIHEVNEMGKTKSSAPSTSSGTSLSSTASAATRSRKPKSA
ncbi:phage tail assembly chaperone family protein, TAC [Pseudomonas typographi]|uniref:phage tail assembly chaperone family protein, TAC n=1 Tax=Pseudomonas typographi TaxID=2715964 RepID=UPI0016876ACE|nr:phage tail assembly chaperone family protein, TAC [Pseudomonas typographi]MBD1589669.1 phage tail protein [Pseudomonas typographi]